MFKALLQNQLAKWTAGGVFAFLAAVGGVTSMQWAQPAVEKTADYAARAVVLYCKLPAVDRQRMRAEVLERLAVSTQAGELEAGVSPRVTIECGSTN